VVAAIAHYSNIDAGQLGKIRLESNHTTVDVPEALVGQLLAKNGAYRIGRRSVNVQRA
jgi:ATP-dependent RNA helicase DeaD